MKTDDLIAALALDAAPVAPRAPTRWLWLAAALAAVAALAGVVLGLGVRADLAVAVGGMTFWIKATYTALIALAGGWLAARLGRPGASARRPALLVLGVFAAAILLGLVNLATTPAEGRLHAWLGHSWRVCTLNVLGLSLLTTPFLFWAAKKFAPTSPTLAGFATGLTSGAIAATLYGLYCQESTAAFVATWYTLGVLAAGGLGAGIGRFWLRW
ncbi:MAG: DUF1109 domain-containing protein [Caulobacteraceae bacterium]|nr:DUF1109 domain-containing protein [Caulobacteraceae bacterium]